jgi:kinetochore protein Spc7/SPC105
LKTFTNTLYAAESSSDSQSSQPQAQSQSQVSTADDANATQSMDLTNDFHEKIHDNTTMKSFGVRRVSFADHAQVRFIEGRDKNKTNSTGPSQSSPVAESPTEQRPPVVTDENAYPGATPKARRRSSIRHSLAGSEGEDMDLTSIDPSAFLHVAGSALMDEELGDDEYSDDMDVTEVVQGHFIRKRSLSICPRRPLTQISQTAEQDQGHAEGQEGQSFTSDDSHTGSESSDNSDKAETMEFTIPLNKSLRSPAEHDEVWLALRKETHSGNTPIEPEPFSDDIDHADVDDGMDLDHAVQRLMRARDSLPSAQPILNNGDAQFEYSHPDDSVSSIEDSLRDEAGSGDQTINVSKVFGRASLADQGNARMSMGYQELTMDESEIYGAIVPPVQSTPQQSKALPQSHESAPTNTGPKLTVFQPPPSNLAHSPAPPTSGLLQHHPAVPIPFSFTPRPSGSSKSRDPTTAPPSPSKTKTKPTFSAAFAPPVVCLSPMKGSSVAVASPNKRYRPHEESGIDVDKPSPAKRPAVATKWPFTVPQEKDTTAAASSLKPKPLSPSKKAPFQGPTGNASGQRPSSSLRRPSGYFARRKSLGTGLGSKVAEEDGASAANMRSSPKKKAGIGLGRASLGSGTADAWTRFAKDSGSDLGHAKPKETETQQCVREASRQAVASPSPTRGSPAPASPRPGSTQPISPVPPQFSADYERTRSPVAPAVDISTLLGPDEFGEKDAVEETNFNPTEQWREGVEPSEFEEDGEVRKFVCFPGFESC